MRRPRSRRIPRTKSSCAHTEPLEPRVFLSASLLKDLNLTPATDAVAQAAGYDGTFYFVAADSAHGGGETTSPPCVGSSRETSADPSMRGSGTTRSLKWSVPISPARPHRVQSRMGPDLIGVDGIAEHREGLLHHRQEALDEPPYSGLV